jgi:hypothetical protein
MTVAAGIRFKNVRRRRGENKTHDRHITEAMLGLKIKVRICSTNKRALLGDIYETGDAGDIETYDPDRTWYLLIVV